MIFLDTETTTIGDDEEIHYPSLIVGVAQYVRLAPDLQVDAQDELVFSSLAPLWEWIEGKAEGSRETVIYAHNWSFDWPVIDGFNMMLTLGYELLSIVDASPPVILRYIRAGQKVTIIDTLNYYRDSLLNIGKAVGIDKLDVDFDTVSIDELTIYCRRDVDIIRVGILKLIAYLYENDLSRLTHTVSSLALSTYIRKYMPCDVYIDANEARVKLSRESYYGARTECFRIGEYNGIYRLIDVNSMYPFVMRNNDYPTRSFALWKRLSVADLDPLSLDYCLTSRVRVETDIPVYPIKIDGRTCFPVGSYTTVLSTPEIVYGLENNLITDVYETVLHNKGRIFESYVDYFYNQRLEYKRQGDTANADFTKKLLNSLYGKFGQTGNEWVETNMQPEGKPRKWEVFDIPTGKRVLYMEIHNKVYYSKRDTESRDSSPAIAAHVTAHGRILMQRTIDYIGRRHIYYGDTDSLLIDETGYKRIERYLHPKALGCWSLDGEYQDIDIRGLKDYRFGDKERIKGIKSKAVRVEDGLYKQIQFSTLRGSIRRGELDAPTLKNIHKHLRRDYRKGRVTSDGVVEPIVLKDGVVVS